MPQQQPGAPLPAAASPKSTNGLAIASMVLGILWVYWVGSILALIFGYVAKGQIDAAGGTQGGRGMAIAGIVLGWVGVGVLLLGHRARSPSEAEQAGPHRGCVLPRPAAEMVSLAG